MRSRILAATLTLLCSVAGADVYTLGSSYTGDALPADLDDSPQWTIYNGRSLDYIFNNPALFVGGTDPWTLTLTTMQFDYISFQPVPSSSNTQQLDLDSINFWLTLQPAAIAVIHTTWPRPADWETDHHALLDNTIAPSNRSKSYYDDLAGCGRTPAERTELCFRGGFSQKWARSQHRVRSCRQAQRRFGAPCGPTSYVGHSKFLIRTRL